MDEVPPLIAIISNGSKENKKTEGQNGLQSSEVEPTEPKLNLVKLKKHLLLIISATI